MKITSAPFNLQIVGGGKPKITREIQFTNGDNISFTITLDRDENATLPELHRQSVQEVINRLQEWIEPNSPT